MNHLSDEQLSALADGALEGRARGEAERHLSACAECRAALAGLVAQDRTLASALGHDPGEAYFEEFAAHVGGRIRAAGLQGAQSRGTEVRGLAEWFRSPRKLALVTAVATVVVGAGIVMLATREVRVPALREKEIEGRVEQSTPPAVNEAPQPPAVGFAAPAPAAAPARPPAAGGAQPGAASAGGGVPSTRAVQMRRNAAGEDVAVRGSGGFAFRPPRVAARPPGPADQPAYVQKPQYVEPLVAAKRRDAATGAAGAVPEESPRYGGPAVAPAKAAASQVAADQSDARRGIGAAADRIAVAEKARPAPAAGQSLAAGRESAAAGRLLGPVGRGPALQVRGAPEAFDGLPTQPRTLAQNARRLTALAVTMDVAPAWDSAADEWERVIEGVQGGPLESETRFQVARARYQAWRLGPDEKRSARVTRALDAFLAHAPRGAERDTVQGWRREFDR